MNSRPLSEKKKGLKCCAPKVALFSGGISANTRPYQLWWGDHSLVPRPHPAFYCLQYAKTGEGLVSFLHVSDIRTERV